jgi:low temperature requirement protein LtrA
MRDDSGQRGRAARGERWARLRRSLWQPPRPHGEQPRERVVGPLELFYDLAVVVLVAQAAHRLAGHLTWSGLGEFTAVFTLVWIAWANGSLHHELHGHEDARARSTFLLQILVLAAMAPSSAKQTARGEQRSPSPLGCCSQYWPCCGC